MESATIEQLGRHEGKVVSLQGWLYGMRKSGKVVFLELRDGTGICQCVVEASAAEAFENARILTQESSLVLEGRSADTRYLQRRFSPCRLPRNIQSPARHMARIS
jgi:aspartyl/asparaginyl-tRNA synthetase